MFDPSEPLGRGRPSRLAAAAAAAVTAACLAVTGCSGTPSSAHDAAPTLGPRPASGAGSPTNPFDLGFVNIEASSPTVPPNPAGPPADPFAGTPADAWADGPAGIVLPAARPVGRFTAAQVELAYQTTRKLLIAADLDQQTLLGAPPTAFADLLTSTQRTTFLGGLNKVGLDSRGYPLSTRSWIMSFMPGDAQLIGGVIKVHGAMRAVAVRGSGGSDQLDIRLDYLFVYPVEPPHRPASWMRVVDEAQWTVRFANWQGSATTLTPWVDDGGSVSGALCGTADGYQHPDYPNEPEAQPGASPTGAPVDPYVMGQPVSGTCRATTGT